MVGSLGKLSDRNYTGLMRRMWSTLWGHKTTIDSSKNDYELFRSLYRGTPSAEVPIDQSMYLGSAFAKPVVNSTMAFALGNGFDVKIAGSDENEALEDIQEDLQARVEKDFAKIYDWLKFGHRDGDGFLFIDELGNSTILKPETVDVIIDSLSGSIVGYNVTEHLTLKDPESGKEDKWVYLKQYRESWIRVTRYRENETQEKGQIIYERIFVNGEDIDTQIKDEEGKPIDLQFEQDEIDKRPLPIIHYKNEAEPAALYGTSELQNILVYMRNYGEALDEASLRERYNAKPVLALSGVSEPAEDNPDNKYETRTREEGAESQRLDMRFEQDTTLYIPDSQGDAKFLTVDTGMENTGKLLEYIFYCIVQASETPEFVFGTATSSSKASNETQMPVVVQKAERKRQQMRGILEQYLKVYIQRQLELSNPTYFPLRGVEPELDIEFPDIVDEDKTLTKETIEMLLTNGIISHEKALQLSAVGDKIDDAGDEVKKGMADMRAREDAQNVLPEDDSRLEDEIEDDNVVVDDNGDDEE